ncbi:MAG: hypothetical protein M1831_006303 [Alyxoria varia]|nr:MAG: hypothetical protein M1831_006303 [Alyxoria varia]
MSDTFAIIESPEAALVSSPSGSTHSTEETSSPHNELGLENSPTRPSPSSADNNSAAAPSIPSAKADKPRPHVCGTCQRPFARLEHLKRHERSHTKEKPFECNNCSRSFARRDLLLRHQQKLHQTGAPPTKKGGPRRESTSGAGPSKVRKNSVSGNARPRANTISHVDPSTLGMIAQAKQNVASASREAKPPPASDNGSMKPSRGMAAASGNHGNPQALPRLATHNLHSSSSEALRTAPPGSNMASFNAMNSFPPGCASTINPAHLHMSDPMSFCGSPFDGTTSPFTPQPMIKEEENDMDLTQGLTQMSFDGSALQSPPPFGDQSQCFGNLDANHLHHSSLDAGSNGNMESNQVQHSSSFDAGSTQLPYQMNWSDMMMPPDFNNSPQHMGGMDPNDFSNFQSFAPVSDSMTPGSMHAQQLPPESPFPYHNMNSAMPLFRPQDLFPDLRGQPQPQMTFGSDGTSGSSPSNSARQSSATSVSTDPQFVKLEGDMPQSMDLSQRY